MNKNQIIIINDNNIEEFDILKSTTDSKSDEPVYICNNLNKNLVAILIKEIKNIDPNDDLKSIRTKDCE